MGYIYSVKVADIGSKHVDFDITVLDPDAGWICDAHTLAFSFLCDPIMKFMDDERIQQTPLGQEVDDDDLLDSSFIIDNAAGFIVNSQVVSGDPGKQAVLRVTVSHSGWLEQLEKGLSWESASCEDGDPAPWSGPLREPGDTRLEVSDDPLEGMFFVSSSGKPIEAYEEGCFVVPAFGPKHYVTKEVATEEITLDDVRHLFKGAVRIVGGTGGFKGEHVGCFLKGSPDSIGIYQESRDGSARGTIGFPFGDLQSVGQAWYVRRIRDSAPGRPQRTD